MDSQTLNKETTVEKEITTIDLKNLLGNYFD